MSPNPPDNPDAGGELQTRAELNQELQRSRVELERLEEQARKAGTALSSVDAARLSAAGRRPVPVPAAGGQGAAPARAPVFGPGGIDPAAAAGNRALAGRLSETAEQVNRFGAGTGAATGPVRSFGERLGEAGRELFRVTGAASGAFYALVKFGELASPSAFSTLQGSLSLLGETVGEKVVPAMWKLADSVQKWDTWLREHSGGDTSKGGDEGWVDFISRRAVNETIAFGTDYFKAAVEPKNYLANIATLWTYPATAAAAGRLSAWTGLGGEDFRKSLFGADMPGRQNFVPPGGGPIAAYTTGTQYAESLQTAGLAVGANDTQTELTRRQLAELESHGGLLTSIEQNQRAMNTYLQSLQAWR